MSDNVIIALITTLLGGSGLLVVGIKAINETVKWKRSKAEARVKEVEAIEASNRAVMDKLDIISTSVNNLAPLIILSLQVHKVELQGIKDGGLNGDCEKWHKRIDEELELMLVNSVKVEDKKK